MARKNDIEIYSTHNEGKSDVSERFIRTLKNKKVHIDKLDDIVNIYNNAYHRIIKMKPVDVKPSSFIDFDKENNKEGPKFKVVDDVRI